MSNREKISSSRVLVTGGAGFIGSSFIRYLFSMDSFGGCVVNLDKLTYAGNPKSLLDIEDNFGGKRYFFERGDICNYGRVKRILEDYDIDVIVHFAAESHVDRSILGPKDFIETNVAGTFALLESVRELWRGRKDVRFHHVSTDEVYGSLGDTGRFSETTPYDPRSPYSASKAASDHLVRAYFHTYELPVTISNCSNNYGPCQFPEKVIPLMILNAVEGKPLPVYGDGKNVRDWLYVEDHCEAVWLILNRGVVGETYNIGGDCEKQNIEVVGRICEMLDEFCPAKNNPSIQKAERSIRHYSELITFVSDRPGHDRRYAINCEKIKSELGWRRRHDFDDALELTIRWYLENMEWVDSVRSGEYLEWVEMNYESRE
jgi:dTDP-glucose 4,6-dehydratase